MGDAAFKGAVRCSVVEACTLGSALEWPHSDVPGRIQGKSHANQRERSLLRPHQGNIQRKLDFLTISFTGSTSLATASPRISPSRLSTSTAPAWPVSCSTEIG